MITNFRFLVSHVNIYTGSMNQGVHVLHWSCPNSSSSHQQLSPGTKDIKKVGEVCEGRDTDLPIVGYRIQFIVPGSSLLYRYSV